MCQEYIPEPLEWSECSFKYILCREVGFIVWGLGLRAKGFLEEPLRINFKDVFCFRLFWDPYMAPSPNQPGASFFLPGSTLGQALPKPLTLNPKP